MPKGVHSNHAKADRQHRWSGNRKIIASSGYVRIRVGCDHPLADPNGYAYEHLVVWVAAGNARPGPGFHLHHKNECLTDNRYGNLQLLTMNQHVAVHGRLKLNEAAALDIRQRYAEGSASQAELAVQYGVPRQRISKVIKGSAWKNAGGQISPDDNRKRDPASGRIIGRKVVGDRFDGHQHHEFPE